jgi:hypothetical protein
MAVRDWEWETMKQSKENDAELGWSNVRMALGDPSLLSETAEWLRTDPKARTQLVNMMASPKFQAQAKDVAERLKTNGELPNLFQMKYYAQWKTRPISVLAQASQPAAAFHMAAGRGASRSSKVHMIMPPAFDPESAAAAGEAPDYSKDKTEGAWYRPEPSGDVFTRDDLIKEAKVIFPIGFFDPLGFTQGEYGGQTNEANIGWLRHAEIKHGRVAMAGFIGFCFHENSIHFPFPFTPSWDWSASEGVSALTVCDNVPDIGKYQIVAAIGFLEWWSELSDVLEKQGEKHYMRGGKPGYYPNFQGGALSLYDPFGAAKSMSEDQKAKRRAMEINNGRLAMIGLTSLISEANIPGSVPFLQGLIKHYEGAGTYVR